MGELDNRGSHFYLAMYWAQALAAQNEDRGCRRNSRLWPSAGRERDKIVAELNGVQGKPVDIGGYYTRTPRRPEP